MRALLAVAALALAGCASSAVERPPATVPAPTTTTEWAVLIPPVTLTAPGYTP